MTLDLDSKTSQLLVRLANLWRVSKEEAVRRALEQAGVASSKPDLATRLAALSELRLRLNLTPAKAEEWQQAVRNARR